MLFLHCIVFALLDLCSSYSTPTSCYGGSYTFILPINTKSIYYMPKTKDNPILVVDQGRSIYPRFEASLLSVKVKDLTEEDDGATLLFDQEYSDSLRIQDCQHPDTKRYGKVFSWKIPSLAQYMEFAQIVSEGTPLKPIVIWNRTDPSTVQGVINYNYFEIYKLKQTDSGYYKFRGSRGELLKWKRLEVEANYEYLEYREGEDLELYFPVEFSFSHILFTRVESWSEQMLEKRYIRPRMEVTDSYFTIRELQFNDAGIYKFIDTDENVAVKMQLEVLEVEFPTWPYIAIAAVSVFAIVICCCCVKKCCCKKSKRNSQGSTEAAAPAVYVHDSNEPTPPAVPLLTTEPRRITTDAMTNNAAGTSIHPPPSTTQATVSGDMGPTSLFTSSTDSVPKYEPKGLVFLSAPPLSSESSIQDVYTSDKLNLL